MSYLNFDLRDFIWMGAFIVLIIWGAWEGIDYLFIDHSIKSKTLIEPEIRLTIKDNKVDTLYIYKKP